MKPQPGLALGGRYRLVRQIAVGGMGEVWVAKDESLARDIAVKVLKEEFVGNPDFLNRFRVEARNAASLSHAHIAQLYDYGEQDGSAYLVMELVHGEPMSDLLEREPVPPIGKLLNVLAQTSRALHAAHVGGVVHRDIKPGNIIIEHSGDVKITDFGVSLAANQVPMTAAGMVMGTAQYLSPEQAIGRPATGASDIYALGIVAYEGIAGNRPFTGKTPVDIAVAHVNEPVPPLPRTTHQELAHIVLKMLAKDPLERPRSAAALAHTFEELARQIAENPWKTTSVSTPSVPVSEALAPARDVQIEDLGPNLNYVASPAQAGTRQSQPNARQQQAPQQHQRTNTPAPAHGAPQQRARAYQQSAQASPSAHSAPPSRRTQPAPGHAGQAHPTQPDRRQGGAISAPNDLDATRITGRRMEGGAAAPLTARQTDKPRVTNAPNAQPTGGSTQQRSREYAPPAPSRQAQPNRREPTPAVPQSIKERILGLGMFTLALIGVILAVILATTIKAIASEGPAQVVYPIVAKNFSSVQFTFDAKNGVQEGYIRGAGINTAQTAQSIKDA